MRCSRRWRRTRSSSRRWCPAQGGEAGRAEPGWHIARKAERQHRGGPAAGAAPSAVAAPPPPHRVRPTPTSAPPHVAVSLPSLDLGARNQRVGLHAAAARAHQGGGGQVVSGGRGGGVKGQQHGIDDVDQGLAGWHVRLRLVGWLEQCEVPANWWAKLQGCPHEQLWCDASCRDTVVHAVIRTALHGRACLIPSHPAAACPHLDHGGGVEGAPDLEARQPAFPGHVGGEGEAGHCGNVSSGSPRSERRLRRVLGRLHGTLACGSSISSSPLSAQHAQRLAARWPPPRPRTGQGLGAVVERVELGAQAHEGGGPQSAAHLHVQAAQPQVALVRGVLRAPCKTVPPPGGRPQLADTPPQAGAQSKGCTQAGSAPARGARCGT